MIWLKEVYRIAAYWYEWKHHSEGMIVVSKIVVFNLCSVEPWESSETYHEWLNEKFCNGRQTSLQLPSIFHCSPEPAEGCWGKTVSVKATKTWPVLIWILQLTEAAGEDAQRHSNWCGKRFSRERILEKYGLEKWGRHIRIIFTKRYRSMELGKSLKWCLKELLELLDAEMVT